ncbi:MAG: hypothetical protein WD079_00410 [Phycisphaeraceae bacterium]
MILKHRPLPALGPGLHRHRHHLRLLDPPLPDRNHYAFVPTGSELHKTLAGATEWGRPCSPVLQLVRKSHGDRKFHLEIEAILAPNWRPQD